MKEKGYKVVYVSYMTPRRWNQKQYAFISGAKDNVAINGTKNDNITDRNINSPLIEVIFYSSLDVALKEAAVYCAPGYIYLLDGKTWKLAS